MSKIYNRLDNDFTQISNTIVTDINITANAFRVYSYMCYRIGINKHWDFFNKDIEDSIKIGRDSLISAKNNLIKYGYLRKIGQEVKDSGKFGACDYEIFKEPSPEFPLSVEPLSENKSTNNTNISKDIFKRSNTITNHITKMDKIVAKKQEEYLSLPEWQNLSEYEQERTVWYINQRKEDHGKTVKNTSKAIKQILLAIFELKAKGLSIDDIMSNVRDKNGCVYQTIRVSYFDSILNKLRMQNNTNSYKNGNSYQQAETYAPKEPLNEDRSSENYFGYRFNEDIATAFGYQECIELANSIIEQKPEFEKVARTMALMEWLQTRENDERNNTIKAEVLDIYKASGYDIFVEKAIKENNNSSWKRLLTLLKN